MQNMNIKMLLFLIETNKVKTFLCFSIRYSYTKSPQDMGTDVLERQLRDKIASNSKNFIKALHLFDYNRDGRIQKHEMRKVIENYAFRMTDEQYDR